MQHVVSVKELAREENVSPERIRENLLQLSIQSTRHGEKGEQCLHVLDADRVKQWRHRERLKLHTALFELVRKFKVSYELILWGLDELGIPPVEHDQFLYVRHKQARALRKFFEEQGYIKIYGQIGGTDA